MMLNILFPCNKIPNSIENTLNKNTLKFNIYFEENSLFSNVKFLKIRNYSLKFMTKKKKADKCKKHTRQYKLKFALFTALVPKK